jgi:glutaminyl-peptide cyclotransferase
MGPSRLTLMRYRKVATFLLIVPLAAVFLVASGISCPGSFESSSVTEAIVLADDPPAKIDGKRAYGYLKKICEIGPRTAGSEANARQRKMVAEHFTKMGGVVEEQKWAIAHPQTGQRLILVNLIARWHPERRERVVIGAHYDTRPHPDEERNPARQALPFIGANDGASGVALEMELAHHLTNLNTQRGVDLVLFDGEELVFGNNPDAEYFLGSTYFATRYKQLRDARRIQYRYVAGMVLDMVGGRDLKLPQEPNSNRYAPGIVHQVWSVADAIKAKSFKNYEGREVRDDHLPLNEIGGIPTIDLIDFEYPFWHKADDLPENCSADSLEEVGRVITTWLTVPAPNVAAPKKRRGR